MQATHFEKVLRPTLQCQLCPQTFLTPTGLQRHVEVRHENKRRFPCNFCDQRFITSSHLKRHVEARHPTSQVAIYSCDKCDYKSHSMGNLSSHEGRHNIANRRSCYFCGKQFVMFSALVRHLSQVHTLEK